MLWQRATGIWRSRRGGVPRHWRGNGPRGAVTARLPGRELWESQALFDLIALLMVLKVLLGQCSSCDRYASKGSNMNVQFLGVAPRAIDNSIASLGPAAPGDTTRGVLPFSRP